MLRVKGVCGGSCLGRGGLALLLQGEAAVGGEVRVVIVVRQWLRQPVARHKLVFLRSVCTSVVVPVLAGVLVAVDTGVLYAARTTGCLRLTTLQDDEAAEEAGGGEHEKGAPVADVVALMGAQQAQRR